MKRLTTKVVSLSSRKTPILGDGASPAKARADPVVLFVVLL